MFRRVILVLAPLLVVGCTGATTATTVPITETTVATTTTTEARDPITVVVEDLIATTEELRGLSFLSTPVLTLVTEEELTERVRALVEDEFDQEVTARYELLLGLLGLIDPETDLGRLYSDIYAEQVAGYYDGDSKEMVVPVGDELPSPLERLILVHELTHALTDQYFEFSGRIQLLEDDQRLEEALALSALVEGDATLTETLYLWSLSGEDQQAILSAAARTDDSVLREAPRFIQELLLFPHAAGSEFVEHVWSSTGFSAIDALYGSPPITTEHIYHPADFLIGEPQERPEPGVIVPDGYTVAEQSIWGQAGFRAMFGQVLDDAAATAAAVGWGGDSYRLLWDGNEEIVFELRYVGDSSIDLREMFETLVQFAARQLAAEVGDSDEMYVEFDGDDFAYVYSDGAIVEFVAATNPEVGRLFAEAVER